MMGFVILAVFFFYVFEKDIYINIKKYILMRTKFVLNKEPGITTQPEVWKAKRAFFLLAKRNSFARCKVVSITFKKDIEGDTIVTYHNEDNGRLLFTVDISPAYGHTIIS